MHVDWWTLALQTINVLILVWLLGRFFYRPVVDIIEKRRAVATKLLDEANAARSAADAEKADIAATRQGFATEHEKIIVDARTKAEAERDTILKQANEIASKLHADGETMLARDRVAMQEVMVQRAGALAVDIARRLLERLPAETTSAAFLEGLSRQVKELPPKSRALLADVANAEVVTAAPLSQSLEAQYRKALEGIIGTNAKLTFRCDPSLIAGLEIRSNAVILRNNWQEDLARILKEVGTDGGQQQAS
jgi:F-type H+-transporting ATPase subunit b